MKVYHVLVHESEVNSENSHRLTPKQRAVTVRNFAGVSETAGAVAQLGERLNGIQEVEGSTPFRSTFSGRLTVACRQRSRG